MFYHNSIAIVLSKVLTIIAIKNNNNQKIILEFITPKI